MSAKVLSAEEQSQLVAIAHQDSTSSAALAARDRLVECSYGLVNDIAKSFAKQWAGFEVDDLIQEGLMSVVDAVRWFNPRRDIHFSTYAGHCIRKRLAKVVGSDKQKPLPQEPDDPDTNPIAQALEKDPDDQYADLRKALERLHPMDRRIIEDRMGINGQVVPWGDLASQIGVPVRIVKRVYGRGLRTLRKMIPEPSLN